MLKFCGDAFVEGSSSRTVSSPAVSLDNSAVIERRRFPSHNRVPSPFSSLWSPALSSVFGQPQFARYGACSWGILASPRPARR